MSEMKIIKMAEMPDPFTRLPRLANRLGVKPMETGHAATVVLTTKDDVKYDLFEILEALLDRIDTVTKHD